MIADASKSRSMRFERLEDILRQLLDTARPLTLNKAPADLTLIARRCVDLLEPKAQKKSQNSLKLHSRSLPVIELDSDKIQQAVINTLLNAIDAAPYGGRVSIWTRLLDGHELPSPWNLALETTAPESRLIRLDSCTPFWRDFTEADWD